MTMSQKLPKYRLTWLFFLMTIVAAYFAGRAGMQDELDSYKKGLQAQLVDQLKINNELKREMLDIQARLRDEVIIKWKHP